MALLPILPFAPPIAGEQNNIAQPSYTYRLNLQTNRLHGNIDNLEAATQAIEKIFLTERFAYVIYPQEYGVELESLIGQDNEFVKLVLQSRILEAIREDDRVVDILKFEITQKDKETLLANIQISTIFGEIELLREVNI
ncbi:MAG: DUF2634 domain-containing protein [Oscillospiraceae bacterium]|jgi:hypothetical protein|nr:DUF2634 domain-containing protein [Oscillospiraceae bacterium]